MNSFSKLGDGYFTGRTYSRWFVAGSVLAVAAVSVANALAADSSTRVTAELAPVSEGSWYRPPVSATWQWQLFVDDDHPLNTAYEADIYNIDLFNTPVATIRSLQAAGRRVVCYLSAGTYENYRQDRDQFADADLGNGLEDWPNERWLDIRSVNVQRIMTERLDLAAEKGCDAVEPDNVQGYLEPTGFDLSAEDQLAYNRFIANQARQRGLGVGLKNDLEQVEALVDYYDFSINEQCFQYNECDLLLPFIQAGKPVLHAEYPGEEGGLSLSDRSVEALCSAAKKLQFSTLVLPVALDDSFRVDCQNQ